MLVPGELHFGYRRRVAGSPGMWVARRYIGKSPECTSGYLKTTLGRADDYEDANGASVLSYADAQRIALERNATSVTADARGCPRWPRPWPTMLFHLKKSSMFALKFDFY